MSIARIAPAFVGRIILLSRRLPVYVNGAWRWLTAGAGTNLVQTAGSGLCPVVIVMNKPGRQPGAAA